MRKPIVVLCALVALSACRSRAPANPSGSATQSPLASTSASPTKKPAHVVSARSAVYAYQNAIWLYDVRTNTTRQVTQGGTVSMPKWIDAVHFSFVQGGNTLKIADLKAATTTDVFTAPGGIQAYGWSPDRQTVAYIETDQSAYPHLRFHSIPDGTTQSVATLARALGRGRTPADDIRVEFSKDGAYVLVVYTPADGETDTTPPEQSQFQIRGSDGSLAFSDVMSREPTMGLFSRDGKSVYFMDSGGVRAWTASSGSTKTLRKMQWFNPSSSPDGRFVAFDGGTYSTSVRIKVLDLRTLTVATVSKAGRGYPVFAGPNTVWAQSISPCSGCDGPTKPDPRVFSIDTSSHAERALAIQSLIDVDVLYA
jgi:Tol biopolymer transport system component